MALDVRAGASAGSVRGTELDKTIWPVRTQFASSRANVDPPNYTVSCSTGTSTRNKTFHGVIDSATRKRLCTCELPLTSQHSKAGVGVRESTTYKEHNNGIWGRGELHRFKNVRSCRQRRSALRIGDGQWGIRVMPKVLRLAVVGENRECRQPRLVGGEGLRPHIPEATMPEYPIRGYGSTTTS